MKPALSVIENTSIATAEDCFAAGRSDESFTAAADPT